MPADPFIPTPEMIAAAWGVLRDRWPGHPHLLGPGPGFREAIEAAFAKMPPQNEGAAAMQWRSISEAPKDRTHVLVGRPGAQPIRAWFQGGRWWMHGCGPGTAYAADLTGHYAPTHFMLLPPPPPARNTPEGGEP